MIPRIFYLKEIKEVLRDIDVIRAIELGYIITGKALKRSSENQITVADLTGVAIQDIQISVAVFKALTANE